MLIALLLVVFSKPQRDYPPTPSDTPLKIPSKEEPIRKEPQAPEPNTYDEPPKNIDPQITLDTDNGFIESFNKGQYKEAIKIFEGLSEDEKLRVLPLAGVSYYRIGDIESAKRRFEDSLRVKENFTALKFLAFIYYKEDDIERSLETANRAIALKTDNELSTLIERLNRELRAKTNMVEESTLHFKVIYDGYEHSAISRKILDILEDAYTEVGRELSYYPNDKITVILYAREAFFDITRAHKWAGGIYDGKIRLPIAGALERPELLKRVLFHEYTHSVIRSITKETPIWLNEGLSEYFSGSLERTGQIIPLRNIETAIKSPDPTIANNAYKTSLSAVSYLIEKYGIYRVRGLLMALGEGKGFEPAFKEAFGMSFEDFSRNWGK